MKKPARTPATSPPTWRDKAPAAPPSLPMAIGARLRHARLVKGLPMKQLAERVGMAISLGTELKTNIGALVEPNWNGVGYIAHAGGRPRIAAGGDKKSAGVTLERLVPNGKGHLLQGNIHIVAPGSGSMGPMRHEGDEVGYVFEGRLELGIDDTVHALGPGDSFVFPSSLAHIYRNPGPDVTRVIWINMPPTF